MLLHALVLVLLSNLCPLQEQYQSIHEALLVFIDSFEPTQIFHHSVLLKFRSQLYIYKWKNHFYEMKGDVGMSLHEKERNNTKTQSNS